MGVITVYTDNKKQDSLLKSLLEAMAIRFQVGKQEEKLEDKVEFTREEYWEKLERSMNGKKYPVTEEFKKSLLI
jgi:predicted Holliday junction resolvase-like endonuclease